MVVELRKLSKGPHKYSATFWNETGKKIKTVVFGARGYSDFLHHKDPERKKLYILRHRAREKWNRSAGKYTAGFWSRWLLWSEPTFTRALRLTESKVGEKIIYKR
jgi:hypothetical protein